MRNARVGWVGLMRRATTVVALGLLLAIGAVMWLKFDRHAPQAALTASVETLGRKTPIDIDLHAGGSGLRTVSVRLQVPGSGGGTPTSSELFSTTYPPNSWRGSGVTEQRLHVEPDLQALKVP